MTTLAAARTALKAATSATDIPVAPPFNMIWSNGSDLRMTGAGSVRWRFRVTCAVGYPGDDAAASVALAVYTASVLIALRSLAGFTVDGIGPDQLRDIAGDTLLTADIAVTTVVTLS